MCRRFPGRRPSVCLPVFAFLAELVFEVSQGEAVGLHDAAVGDLLTTEEVGEIGRASCRERV